MHFNWLGGLGREADGAESVSHVLNQSVHNSSGMKVCGKRGGMKTQSKVYHHPRSLPSMVLTVVIYKRVWMKYLVHEGYLSSVVQLISSHFWLHFTILEYGYI